MRFFMKCESVSKFTCINLVDHVTFNVWNENTKSGNLAYWLTSGGIINLGFNSSSIYLSYEDPGGNVTQIWTK